MLLDSHTRLLVACAVHSAAPQKPPKDTTKLERQEQAKKRQAELFGKGFAPFDHSPHCNTCSLEAGHITCRDRKTNSASPFNVKEVKQSKPAAMHCIPVPSAPAS